MRGSERVSERERDREREREDFWSVWAMEICREVLDSGDKRLQAKFKHALNVIDRTLALYKSVSIYFPCVFSVLPALQLWIWLCSSCSCCRCHACFTSFLLVLFFSVFNPNFLVQLQLAFVSFFPGCFFFFWGGPAPAPLLGVFFSLLAS